jgi:LytS/YehU family sensor histidine kinase
MRQRRQEGDEEEITMMMVMMMMMMTMTIIIIIITEIQRMWNVKAKVIPIITGVTGTISQSLRQYLSNIPGKLEIKGLQKTAMLGTTHILRKVLM